MLWHKSWLETRWRFLIGFALVVLGATGAVLAYPKFATVLAAVPAIDVQGELGRRIREGAELGRTYHGYLWSQWLRQSLTNMLSLFAILLGTGGLLSRGAGGGALFTLSLPVSRTQLMIARTATGLAELLVLCVVPQLMLPLLSPAVGQSFGLGDALVHGICFFVASGVLFSIACLLSTMFTDVWRPALIVCGFAFVLGSCEAYFDTLSRYSLFGIMNGELYFRGGGLPWLGLLASAAVSAVTLFAASSNLARQDF